ncbi:hypothetical protein HYW46_04705 [Candidatus Daviesbacteria bacterium]|nr:hypothetical protein [Candidatus Daviesbacteria bacterium]
MKMVIGIVLLALLLLTAILTLRGLKTPQGSASPAGKTGSTKIDQNCTSTDYGGCDSEKNFYQWKDDGLRK